MNRNRGQLWVLVRGRWKRVFIVVEEKYETTHAEFLTLSNW